MNILRRLFRQEQKQSISTIIPDSVRDKEEYVRRCLTLEFQEKPETRTFRSNKLFEEILTPLNSDQYPQTIMAAQKILPRFKDFDLVYKWLGSAYRSIKQFDRSREILAEGLAKAKRKSLLLTDMGETESQFKNIAEAVYWWSQALHCLSSNPIDYNAYLLLSYVAKGLELSEFEQLLLAHVDSLRSGQVRLAPSTANGLVKLVVSKKTEGMREVLLGLQNKYFSSISTETEQQVVANTVNHEFEPEDAKLVTLLESTNGRATLVNILIDIKSPERLDTISSLSKLILTIPSQKQNISNVVRQAIKQGYGNVEIISLLNLFWRLGDPRALAIGQLADENKVHELEEIIKEL